MSESIPHGWQAQQPGEYPAPAAPQQWGEQQQWGAQPPQQQPQQQPAPDAEPEQEQLPSEFDYLFRGSPASEQTSLMPPRGLTPPPAPAPPQQGGYQQAGYQQGGYQQAGYQGSQPGYQAPQQPDGYGPPQGQQYPQQQPYGYPQQQADTGLVPGFGGSGGDYPDRQGWQPEPGGPGGGSRRTIAVIAGVAVVAIVVGVSVAVFSSGGGGPSTPVAKTTATGTVTATSTGGSSETAKQEADAIYSLIQTASSLRRQVGSAVDSAGACRNEAQDAATLTSVSQQRQQLAGAVVKLPVDKINQGSQLTSLLAKAWSDSAADDQDYAAWAQANASCKGKASQNGSYQQAVGMNSQISNEKSQAVNIWNQVAVPDGEVSISSSDL